MSDTLRDPSQVIAIVGMAGRFPGAASVEEYWSNLCRGVESITFFSDRELVEAGVPAELRESPRYVPARSVLDDIESFDAELFGFSPREAEVMDPQLRIFLECAWEALERAGCDPERYGRPIGVYAGVSMNTYLLQYLLKNPAVLQSTSALQLRILNDKDFLTTWVSYRLGLRGPSMAVQTACSTSLVAVHVACQSLLSFECDAALAGGVAVAVPQRHGYLYEEGSIFSPDGHCRPFDAAAQGTVSGNGAGLVLLKRLEDALADGDPVHALIRGTAVNNDGSLKMGYLAPSTDSQAEAIAAAQSLADVSPETLGYIETHGTGTQLGDPIEVAALTRVFREGTDRRAFCALGSVKSNIGHLDQAAGVVGLIKAALAVEHGLIPPSLHFENPNPEIDFAESPFYVNTRLAEWHANGHPRRAGVSSFGVGGTNAHVVIEQPPPRSPSGLSRTRQLLLLSARTPAALDALTRNLGRWLGEAAAQEPTSRPALADVAWTLQVGRRELEHRRALVCEGLEDAAAILCGTSSGRLRTGRREKERRSVAFLFPGQGSQYPDMGLELYRSEPVFRNEVDRCCELLAPRLGFDLRSVLYPGLTGSAPDPGRLAQTSIAQPALFVVEHALARLWMQWGIEPKAMIGHSLGEYVAACIAGVLTLEDALAAVSARGRLMQGLRRGSMLSVEMAEEELAPLLGERLSLAAVNGPRLCVVSGLEEEVESLRRSLEERGIEAHRLHTSHAFHSSLMDPVLAALTRELERIELRPPEIPFISSVTGTWITDGEATDPSYWARQLRQTVRFADGAATLLRDVDAALLEVGPGRTLSTFVRAQAGAGAAPRTVVTSLRHARDERSDLEHLLDALGRLWIAGTSVDWQGFYAGEERRREVLPTYPFDRKRYWIDRIEPAGETVAAAEPETVPVHHDRPALATAYEQPREEVESAVAEIWSELLGIRDIGIHDDFFELGGHSLLAVRVVSRLRDRFGAEVSAQDLFHAPTVAALAARLGPLRSASTSAAPAGDARPVRPERAAASFAQQRLWLQCSLDPQSPIHNLFQAVRLEGVLRLPALEGAFCEIVRRHETLRTSFAPTDDGGPVQVISPVVRLPLPLVDLASLPDAGRQPAAVRLISEDVHRPFDLNTGPLLRTLLLRIAPEEHLLLLTIHHIISDAWSLGVLLREISELYQAFSRGEPSPLPELPVQYADYAAWQRSALAGDALESQIGYWRERLAGAPMLELPTDHPRPAVPSFRGGRRQLAFSAEMSASLRELAASRAATPFAVLLAVFELLLLHVTGKEDVVVGVPVSGRSRLEHENLIGYFVNAIALRTDLGGNPTFSEVVERVRAGLLEAYAHQDLPFEMLVEALRPRRRPNQHPFFQVVMNHYADPLPTLPFQGLRVTPLDFASETAKYDMTMYVREAGGRFHISLVYDRELFEEQTAAGLLGQLEALVHLVVQRPETTAQELCTALREEMRQRKTVQEAEARQARQGSIKNFRQKLSLSAAVEATMDLRKEHSQ